jgi:arylsulfatase A-like enzyme
MLYQSIVLTKKNLQIVFGTFLITFFLFGAFSCNIKPDKPLNILVLHTDQWRAQALGYSGDPNVKTPNLDRFARNNANMKNAVSGMPVCTPHRASFMTGQYPLTHGLFMNDVQLDTNAISIGKVFTQAGYNTGYIGKWHLDGRGRSEFTPPGPRRQGFEYWKALECSHNYNKSAYYMGMSSVKRFWKGYNVIEETKDAQNFIAENSNHENPFFLFLSYGTPHAPYHSAPQEYKDMYSVDSMVLRPNVPAEMEGKVKKDLAGYYAHCTALDDKIGEILRTLDSLGIRENTLILFTSDHGDLLGSQGAYKKQQPFEESIRIPMIISHPEVESGEYEALINSPDLMPTLLGFAGIDIPQSVEGYDFSQYLLGKENLPDTTTLISCVQPFGQWNRFNHGGKEFRGIVSLRYTYTRDLQGPWLLFDNIRDPFQMNNLVDNSKYSQIQDQLDYILQQKLEKLDDEFRPGMEYVKQWGYPVNKTETVPYMN